jgi:hypothetical protein
VKQTSKFSLSEAALVNVFLSGRGYRIAHKDAKQFPPRTPAPGVFREQLERSPSGICMDRFGTLSSHYAHQHWHANTKDEQILGDLARGKIQFLEPGNEKF